VEVRRIADGDADAACHSGEVSSADGGGGRRSGSPWVLDGAATAALRARGLRGYAGLEHNEHAHAATPEQPRDESELRV
jgi:hypothetical protein